MPIPPTHLSFTNPGILSDDAAQFQASFSASTETPAPLKSILPSIGLTKHKVKQLESICLVREQRENCRQELAFNARPFVLCGLPLRRPPATQQVHRRRNGKFFLHIVSHPDFGLPYGQDRLIPIWIATLAVRQKSCVARFEAASQMLDFFHLSKDGRHYRRIVEGFQRVFAATIFFGTEEHPGINRMIDSSRFHFFDNMRLWFSSEASDQGQTTKADNAITLSQAFYDEINQHPIPVEREVIAVLANAPGVLDFYVWLVWKSFTLRGRPARIPLLGTAGLAQQLGNAPYAVARTFRLTIQRWLRIVRALWPQCPATIADDGLFLVVEPFHKTSAICRAKYDKTRGVGNTLINWMLSRGHDGATVFGSAAQLGSKFRD